MTKDKVCNLKKIKEVGDEYKLTFDCGLKMPIKKELIAGLPEPKVGDKLCPEHTWLEKVKAKKVGKLEKAAPTGINVPKGFLKSVLETDMIKDMAGVGAGTGYLIDDSKIKKQIAEFKND